MEGLWSEVQSNYGMFLSDYFDLYTNLHYICYGELQFELVSYSTVGCEESVQVPSMHNAV